MRKKIYDVWFVREVGHVTVKAHDPEEAKRLAELAPDNFYQEVDVYDTFANDADECTEEEIRNTFPGTKIYDPDN